MSSDLRHRIDRLNHEFLSLHHQKERRFWETKMGLSQEHQAMSQAELALRRFVGDAARLDELRDWRARPEASPAQQTVLDGWIEMFRRNVIEDPQAQALEEDLIALETELERRRGGMDLAYVDPKSGARTPASSTVLGNMVRSDEDESRRHAAWEGLRSIEDFVLAQGFPETVALRNRLARRLGYEDYYDFKVQWAEGFDKKTLFGLLDDLELRTANRARHELEELAQRHGAAARNPWNHSFLTAGSLDAEREPWFRFEDALGRWGRSFAALGIRYRGARVRVDLVDRAGKYENGFMHGPTPAFFDNGRWIPAEINFTANAVPDQPGSGYVAMVTLFHEGGHAAHFANILSDAPCFSQEFAPTSTAFSETQSMFLDSLLEDADWQSRYARDADGSSLPSELMERRIALKQPALALDIRRLLVVCYVEKELYELPEHELNAERILEICRAQERRLLFFEDGGPRPTLSVPHLLSGDASCYYHGYVLADMAVAQTRTHFLERYGHITDNPRVGADLARHYWAPGNMVSFLDYVERLTGAPLRADALVARADRSVEEAIAQAKHAVRRIASVPEHSGRVDLELHLTAHHGPELICDTEKGFEEAAAAFANWVRQRYPRH